MMKVLSRRWGTQLMAGDRMNGYGTVRGVSFPFTVRSSMESGSTPQESFKTAAAEMVHFGTFFVLI